MTTRSDLELALEKGAELVVWPTPSSDLVNSVLSSLTGRRPRRTSWRLVLVPVFVLLVLVFVVSTDARQAVADLFTTAGVRIGWLDESPTPGGSLELGQEIGIGDLTGEPMQIVRDGPPDAVYRDLDGSVHFVWEGAEQLPASADRHISMLLTQRVGVGGSLYATKSVDAETIVTEVAMGSGLTGLWIEGAPHYFTLLDLDGMPYTDTSRLAANVLLWEAKGLSFRLETTGDLASALDLVSRLEPH